MKIGYIGLGAMGRPMAVNIANAGIELVVTDTDPTRTAILAQRGAEVAPSAKAVADEADIILTCLPNLAAADAVALGAEGVIAGGRAKAFVNMGTTGSAFSRDVAEKMQAASKAYLDAPISGGPPGAEAGTLGIMCSGDRDTFAGLEATFEAIAAKVVYLGDTPGHAQVMKLVNNIIFFGNLAVALEAMTLGAKAGLDPEQMIEVINASSGKNSATDWLIPDHVLNGALDFGGANYIIEKDLELWRQEAEAYDVPGYMGNLVRTLFRQMIAEEGKDKDFTRIFMLLERMAGVEMKKTR